MEATTLLTLVLMACSTYFTRVIGYLLLRGRTLSPRMQYVMESLPGCVLISVIAPAFVSERPADLLALVVTLVAASRLPILPTVLIGIASAGALRHWLGLLLAGQACFRPSVRAPVVDVRGMQVSSSTSASASGAASSSGGNDIVALQRKLKELQQALKEVSSENIDAKAKQTKAKLLQSQIMMVQSQIEALMRARQQAQIDKQREQQQAAEAKSPSQPKSNKAPGLGGVVDVYV